MKPMACFRSTGRQTRSDRRIDKNYLHKLLRNRRYPGELSHKGN